MRISTISLIFVLFFTNQLLSQKATLSGTITDPSGETLIGVNVYDINNPAQGTTTNTYGLYSITLPADTHTIVISYIGFSTQELEIDLTRGDVELNIEMSEGGGIELDAVTVTGDIEEDRNIQDVRMGVVSLPLDKIKELPSLFGEPDPLKLAQLGPGISSATDGGSGIYVRGGGVDQNLILLDEAVVYNSGHILGFFSIFNPDALKKTTIYKGAMPANYGGRLSSVVDIQMKDGNKKHFGLDGGIGLVSSRLTAQGPIVKDKSSFIISGRRTYAYDLAKPFLKGSDFEGTNYFFYDLNAKINHQISDKDKIYFSGYFGRDLLNFTSVLRDANFGINYGNLTGTFRWNHKISNQLFMNTSIIYNNYDYAFESRDFGIDADITSGVADWNAKVDFDYSLTPHNIKFGLNFIRHKLTPNVVEFMAADGGQDANLFGRSGVRYGNEYALYALDEYKINSMFSVNIGIRATAYTLCGPYNSLLSGQEFQQGEPVVTHYGIEPRLLGNYILSDESSFKAGFAITNQYLHMVTNSASSLPLEIWVPSTDRVLPQRGWQASMGYFQNFEDNQYEFSIEGYFRSFKNQIDYAENYVNDPTLELEDQFVFGNGLAYGLEFFLRKRKGDLTGWLSYTAARTERLFPEINNGRPYPALQDRPHDFSALLSYNLNPKWNVSAIFVYSSGTPITPIKGFFIVEQGVNYLFGARNSQRMQAYHRLDLSATILPSKENPRYESSWTIAVYNVYDNRNPLFQYYVPEQDEKTGQLNLEGRNVSFFPVIPSLTWNFSWKPKAAVEAEEAEKKKTGI
ncbi:MAG: TonB-dependent receptor [Bacteroidota bacterium]